MGINPFRPSKWRHRSTTVEMRQEDNQTKSPPNNNDTQAAAAQQPSNAPDQQKTNKKQAKQVPFNSDSLLNGIGDYIFESPLGDGKFSKVMLARHYLTGNQVAIKVKIFCY